MLQALDRSPGVRFLILLLLFIDSFRVAAGDASFVPMWLLLLDRFVCLFNFMSGLVPFGGGAGQAEFLELTLKIQF